MVFCSVSKNIIQYFTIKFYKYYTIRGIFYYSIQRPVKKGLEYNFMVKWHTESMITFFRMCNFCNTCVSHFLFIKIVWNCSSVWIQAWFQWLMKNYLETNLNNFKFINIQFPTYWQSDQFWPVIIAFAYVVVSLTVYTNEELLIRNSMTCHVSCSISLPACFLLCNFFAKFVKGLEHMIEYINIDPTL